ncbi:hypothetical protein IWW55_000656 [Coemansia sp. RSA 2706]|nr:hypothetical protein LPJ63_002138 [Coemansia sp. RSA 2711]KAJ2308051.1 hypothetical protein IWW55_000656 [Coemansia sp. RSA 2706]KAJ2313918.1 hypothetical protein IWW54_001229 [Coemansia sp. RSA 2705]KAJ2320950.1 hypothetical protein IWW52_001052 [Coemansia sp. RSA 2704]KAJ2328503.1 hypothetical protein IWW51_001170 [Coemansia sp. RSA 2702]KAJ2367338.1 hypothetical protein H4S01_002219 [Coemansia sp. RSA 2610]KAJ2380364.1 hypothetical protein H4S02_006722 [Coemansia sp. RSA 2611]KAJ273845
MSQVRQVSSLFKIARWGVLGAGLSYGFVHARSLRNDANARRIEETYARKIALIEEAKRKFAEQKAAQSGSGDSAKFDFEDPNFDADKWFKHVEAKFQ